MAVDLVFVGPPGAGKGTQAARIAGERGAAHIATGDMLRAAVRDGTELGHRARGDHGPWRPGAGRRDHRDDPAAADRTGHRGGFVLDGFRARSPRPRRWTRCWEGIGRSITLVPVFEIGLETLVRRLSGRRVPGRRARLHLEFNPPRVEGVCDRDQSELYQREDDREDVIRARYRKQWVDAATPVVEYYRDRGLVVEIAAEDSRDEVGRALDAAIDGTVAS